MSEHSWPFPELSKMMRASPESVRRNCPEDEGTFHDMAEESESISPILLACKLFVGRGVPPPVAQP